MLHLWSDQQMINHPNNEKPYRLSPMNPRQVAGVPDSSAMSRVSQLTCHVSDTLQFTLHDLLVVLGKFPAFCRRTGAHEPSVSSSLHSPR